MVMLIAMLVDGYGDDDGDVNAIVITATHLNVFVHVLRVVWLMEYAEHWVLVVLCHVLFCVQHLCSHASTTFAVDHRPNEIEFVEFGCEN